MRLVAQPITHRVGNRRWLLAMASVVIALACQDTTQPTIARRLSPASPHRSTVVTPGNLHGWVFYDDQNDTVCTVASVCQFVQGPAPVPLGGGSAELATPAASDGKALLLPAYGGTRFDSITDLRYSTYRQTADPGNNLAVSLQFNVDYDLTDTAHAYQGRIVFEPYQGAGGNVPQNTWQTWDAKAGKWWGTKSSVRKNGAVVTNPCVQATPCAWAQLLSAFPDIGVHATLGAVVLKAGSNWAGFRGNVDQLVIGVGGTTTVYDFELQAPLVHLHTEITTGVAGTRLPADSDYTPGAVVRFSLSPAAGHDSLVVVVDDTLAAAIDSIVMDTAHTIAADADSVVVPSAAVLDLETRLRSLLTASDMPAAYSDFLQWYLDRAKVIGSDALQAQLDLASRLSIDPYRDATALVAFDSAMAGTATVVDHFGGADFTYYYSPEDYGGGAAANSLRSRQPTTPLRGRTGSHRVPAALLSRRMTRPIVAGPRRSAFAADPTWTAEPIEIIYVNGIKTRDVSDVPGQGSATETTDRLRNVVYDMMGVSDANGDANTVEVTHFYNPNLAAQLAAYDSTHLCAVRTLLTPNPLSSLLAGVKYANCTGGHYVRYITENFLTQSVEDFVQNRFHLNTPLVASVDNLAHLIWRYQFWGYHTILLTHSQGNMVAELAAERVPNFKLQPLESYSCYAQLTMSSPIEKSQFRFDHKFLQGFDINGDLLLVLGLPNDFDKFDTDTSQAGAAAIANLVAAHKDPLTIFWNRLQWGSKIHGVDYNYFTYQDSRSRVQTQLGQLRDHCVADSIQVNPSVVTLSLGDSLKAVVTVLSRTGDTLLSRRIVGDGLRANLEDDSVIVALAPTSGAEVVPVKLSSTGQILGHVSVTVRAATFPGTIREYRTSTWVDTMEHSQNDSTGGIPPRPSSDPSWDGTPGDCNKGVRTTSGTSWTDWAQRCTRSYVLEVPADPMPVRTKLRLAIATYPDGSLALGPISDLLTPGTAVSDTVAGCFQEYCVRQAVVQSLNANNIVMTSDTLCFSDRCGASQNRVPIRAPAPASPQPKGPPSSGGSMIEAKAVTQAPAPADRRTPLPSRP